MEAELNKLGKIEVNKHSKSTMLGIVMGLISVGIIVLGLIMSIKNYLEINFLVGGIILCVTGLTLLIVMTFIIIKISKKEIETFEIKFEKSIRALEDYRRIAKELRGVGDGSN